MSWTVSFAASLCILVGLGVLAAMVRRCWLKKYVNAFYVVVGGVFLACAILFVPVCLESYATDPSMGWKTFLMSIHNSLRLFVVDGGLSDVTDNMGSCPEGLKVAYSSYAAALLVIAPLMTFGFVLSFFKNLSAYFRYFCHFFRDAYVFSELNIRSITLADDIHKKHPKAVIVFTDVFESEEEQSFELGERARGIGAICFKKDILAVRFGWHARSANIRFFTIGENQTENISQSIKLIEQYGDRENTHLLVFSTGADGELLLTAMPDKAIRVRRVDEVRSMVNRILCEEGPKIFEKAIPAQDGQKDITAVVVGMGGYGCSMVKSLSWFCQMVGYRVHIHAFDRDPLAEDKFAAQCPELMDPQYNGVYVDGEAQYSITVHSGMDALTKTFADRIMSLKGATYVLVSLGSDELNIRVAADLRMYFERCGAKPVIQAIVHNTDLCGALAGIHNYRGQPYDIDFIGDLKTSYSEGVILNSQLEQEGLARHLKWGQEADFWRFEYNYRSSVASAIHMRARIACGIPGAGKKEEELTEEEIAVLEPLEHCRWNAYMRAEGYVFSGSKDKRSRNDLAKMHHDLVDFSSLSEEDKRKDRHVGSQ